MSDDAVTVEMEQFTIGKSDGCDVALNHPTVSRAHAKIYFTKDTVLIEDLDSQNGTFVFFEGEYKRIKTAKIRMETQVRFGSTLEARSIKDVIDDYVKIKARKKADIFQKVKSVELKRCFDCGSVLEKVKVYCDCCGAIFEETA